MTERGHLTSAGVHAGRVVGNCWRFKKTLPFRPKYYSCWLHSSQVPFWELAFFSLPYLTRQTFWDESLRFFFYFCVVSSMTAILRALNRGGLSGIWRWTTCFPIKGQHANKILTSAYRSWSSLESMVAMEKYCCTSLPTRRSWIFYI